METKQTGTDYEAALELQVEQFRMLHRISRIWAAKSEPDIPCFEIEMECDGSYSLSFMDSREEVISEPYHVLADKDMNIVLPGNRCVIGYNPQTGELSSGDTVYIPFKSRIETEEEWREQLADRLGEPDDPKEKESLEYNRRIILGWICCEWMPENKSDVPNILISRSIPSEYEVRFLKGGKTVLPEACLVRQDYEAFFFELECTRVDIAYFPAVDRILVGGTYYTRAAIERQAI